MVWCEGLGGSLVSTSNSGTSRSSGERGPGCDQGRLCAPTAVGGQRRGADEVGVLTAEETQHAESHHLDAVPGRERVEFVALQETAHERSML